MTPAFNVLDPHFRSIYVDLPRGTTAPIAENFMRAVGKRGIGVQYRVCTKRMVKRRDPNARPRCQLQVVLIDECPAGEPVLEFRWYPRKKKRAMTFEQLMRRH